MANIFNTAKYILNAVGGEVSTMKLQKLCYYSQAYTLAWDGQPLFNEDFLRWDNGPVCRELFDIHHGYFSINASIIPDSLLCPNGLSDEEKNNINLVIEGYGNLSGAQLSDLTHRESPWLDTLKDKVISKELMMDFYKKLIAAEG